MTISSQERDAKVKVLVDRDVVDQKWMVSKETVVLLLLQLLTE